LDTIPGTVFTTGDNAYPDGTAENFAECYDPSWGRHKERTRPSPGNHDYHTPGGAAYFEYFGDNAGDPDVGYYSYDIGGWHVISLNSELDMDEGSPQEQWLRSDLLSSRASCTVAYWHHPFFSSGALHGGDKSVRPVWDALYEHHVEIVLNGHEHFYERFGPQTPEGSADTEHGIRQFTVGSGGAGLYGFQTPLPNSEERNSSDHGVLVLTLFSEGYQWEFVSAEGSQYTDRGSAACHAEEPLPNNAPFAEVGGPYYSEGPVRFDGSASNDPEKDVPLTYAWTFGDGSSGTGVSPVHEYGSDGTYTVTLVVTDTLGASSAPAATTASIGNQPPAVRAGEDITARPATPFAVDASFSDLGADDAPWDYTFDWGDGSTTTARTETMGSIPSEHAYADVGQYQIMVSVTDKDGATGRDSVQVSVLEEGYVLVGAGNIARCGRDNDEATASLLDGIPGTVFTLGDNVHDVGSPAEFQDCYQPTWGRHKARTRPTPGDHDYETPGASGYFSYFGEAAGEPAKGYYSFDLGPWHVVALNSRIDMGEGSHQHRWLREDLAASESFCTIAYFHDAQFYSSDSGEISRRAEDVWHTLYEAGAELIVNSERRYYERYAPQRPDGIADPSWGIRQFIVGTGGWGRSSLGVILPNSEIQQTGTYGVLKLTLYDARYEWEFVPVDGGTFADAGIGNCHGPPPMD